MLEHVTDGCQCEGKQCTKCGKIKCIGAFRKNGSRFRRDCRDCSLLTQKRSYRKKANYYKSKAREYALAHPEEVKARKKAYAQRTKEQKKAYDRQYYRANAERILHAANEHYARNAQEMCARQARYYRENTERFKARIKNYNRLHPEIHVVRQAKRRTRISQAGGKFRKRQWEELKASYGYRCLACGKSEPDIQLCADHVIPVAEGGSSDITNIQPLCKPCNSRKRTKVIDYRLQVERGA